LPSVPLFQNKNFPKIISLPHTARQKSSSFDFPFLYTIYLFPTLHVICLVFLLEGSTSRGQRRLSSLDEPSFFPRRKRWEGEGPLPSFFFPPVGGKPLPRSQLVFFRARPPLKDRVSLSKLSLSNFSPESLGWAAFDDVIPGHV